MGGGLTAILCQAAPAALAVKTVFTKKKFLLKIVGWQ